MSQVFMRDQKNRQKFYSGISGLQVPVPKYKFPEEFKSYTRLQYYATFFNSIEINSTFYKLPKKETVANWSSSVDQNFQFTFKLWRDISHSKPFDVREADVVKFMECISGAADKAGCLLIQFPPGLKPAKLNKVEELLGWIHQYDPQRQWAVAMEFRDKMWYNEEVYEMLKGHQAGIVIHDKARTASPFLNPTADLVYLRFHGPSGNYRGSYDDDFLFEYAEYIREWLQEGKTVFVYFNNTMGDSFANLQTLNSAVKSSKLKV